jgi:type II secretory pathway component GspD/PulD (secretin)
MKRLIPITQWFSRTPGLWLHGILVSLVLSSLPVCAAYAANPAAVSLPGKITLQDGKMTARIVAAPLRQVLEEVSKLSGTQVRWLSLDGEEAVSVEFTDLPFSEALRRILGEKDFVLFYPSARERARLPQIWIYPRGQAGGQLVVIQEGETTPPALSDAAPSVEPDLDSLIETALHDQDMSVRLDAITQLGGYAQEDQRVETILSQVAHSDSNPQLRKSAAELLQNME